MRGRRFDTTIMRVTKLVLRVGPATDPNPVPPTRATLCLDQLSVTLHINGVTRKVYLNPGSLTNNAGIV